MSSRRLKQLNSGYDAVAHDPEVATRIAQYEMAFLMQASVPELMNATGEPDTRPGFVRLRTRGTDHLRQTACCPAAGGARGAVHQLYHKDWDHHGGVKNGVRTEGAGNRPGVCGADQGPQGPAT